MFPPAWRCPGCPAAPKRRALVGWYAESADGSGRATDRPGERSGGPVAGERRSASRRGRRGRPRGPRPAPARTPPRRAGRTRPPTRGRGRALRAWNARSAARCARRTGRRRGAAGRSSPSAAWRPARRPPTGSRTPKSERSRSRSQASGSSGARNVTDGGAPPGGRPSATSRSACARRGSSSVTTWWTPRMPSTRPGGARRARRAPRGGGPRGCGDPAWRVRPAGAQEELGLAVAPRSPWARYRLSSRWRHLLALGLAFREQVGREEALGEVVDAPVALAPRDAEDPGLGQRLEDGPRLTSVPSTSRSRPVGSSPSREGAVAPDPSRSPRRGGRGRRSLALVARRARSQVRRYRAARASGGC